MEIVADVVIPHPRPLVFAAYRDRLPDLVPHLPNIRAVKVISRADRGAEVDLVNEWKGGGDIPAAARSLLSESMLTWTDHATWFEEGHRVTWRTDVHAFRGAVTSAGENRFIEIPEGTRFELRGTFTCDAAKIPGVPRLFARSVGGTVEKVMVSSIAKNTHEMARAVAKLIAAGPDA